MQDLRGFLVSATGIDLVRLRGISAISRSVAGERMPILVAAATAGDLAKPGDAVLELFYRILSGEYFRVVHYSLQGNHVHAIVEAARKRRVG